jgi:hypothetical protein
MLCASLQAPSEPPNLRFFLPKHNRFNAILPSPARMSRPVFRFSILTIHDLISLV